MLRIPFILVLNIFSLARYATSRVLAGVLSVFASKKRRYVKLSVEGGLPFGHPRGLGRFGKSEATFLDYRRDIKTIAEDKTIAGVVLEPGKTSLGAARSADLLEELDTLRASGKHVVAHADSYQTRDYLEATAADALLVAPAGRLYTFGPRFEQFFLAGTFEKFGIDAQFIHIGAFKAAASRYVRTGLSSTESAMMTELREGIVEQILARVAQRRRLTVDAAKTLFDGPLDSRRAQGAGLLDGEAFSDDLERWLESPDQYSHTPDEHEGEAEQAVKIESLHDYLDRRVAPLKWRPLRRPPQIAVLDLSGMIVHAGMNIPGSSSVIDPSQLIPVLKRLESNRRVVGVVLHINSPGGSALAADLIWNAVASLRSKKPVVAYCSDIAASGGYYIAVGADRIICRAETITGSIGVVAGKFAVGGVLERLGVTTQSTDGDDGSEFVSLFTAMPEHTLNHLKTDARAFYRRFLERVGQARGIEKRRMHRFARGRVYLGDQAVARNLVDRLGGFNDAVKEVRSLVAREGAPLPDNTEIAFFSHQTRTLKDVLKRSAMSASGADALAEPLAVARLAQRDPLLALMPWNVRFS